MYNRGTAWGADSFCQEDESWNEGGIVQGETVQREPQGNMAKKQESVAKYTIKDSIFTALFQDKKYLIQLYRALHPEDSDTTEDELKDITIRNVPLK